jgi:hypothetical protein
MGKDIHACLRRNPKALQVRRVSEYQPSLPMRLSHRGAGDAARHRRHLSRALQ